MTSGADFNREEELQAKRDGATLVANSGRGMRKGDARLEEYLLDYKFTDKNSYTINLKKLKEFNKQAWLEGYEPITVAVFRSDGGEAYAIINWETLKELIRIERECYDHRSDFR